MSNKNATAARRRPPFALATSLSTSLATSFALLAGSPLAATGATDARETATASESVDAFARRQLDERMRGGTSSGSGLELMFTQAEGQVRSAYLLVDRRYGKDVRRGDVVKGWTVRAIDSDSVEIGKDGRREKLLLASEVTSDQATASADRAETR